MHHVVLDDRFRVVVLRRVENQVSRFHIFLLQVDWTGIILVALVARAEFEAEVFP